MNTLPDNADGTVAAVLIACAAIVALVIVAAAFHAWVNPQPAPAPRPAKPIVHRCHGAHCFLRGYFRDWHVDDAKWVWSCSGCHNLGHHMGWLTYSPDHIDHA